MRRHQLDRDVGIVRRDARDERPAAAGDEVGGLGDGRRRRARDATGPNASISCTASDGRVVEAQQRAARRRPRRSGPDRAVRAGDLGRRRSSRSRSGRRPPRASPTCAAPRRAAPIEASGPIVTPSARGSPIDDALGDARPHGGDRGHRPNPAGTIARRIAVHFCPALSRHLGHELAHVGVELGRARRRRPAPSTEALIESVSLVKRTPPVCTHSCARSLSAVDALPVNPTMSPSRRLSNRSGHAAADQLQRAVGQQPRLDEDAHQGLGQVAGRASPASRASARRRGTRARTSRASPTPGS